MLVSDRFYGLEGFGDSVKSLKGIIISREHIHRKDSQSPSTVMYHLKCIVGI